LIVLAIIAAGIAVAGELTNLDREASIAEESMLGNGIDPDLTRDFDAEESAVETRH
jgi:hypothetical protein